MTKQNIEQSSIPGHLSFQNDEVLKVQNFGVSKPPSLFHHFPPLIFAKDL